jgi:hypothetical protein
VCKSSACRLLVIATILAVSFVAFPVARAMAYDDGSVPTNVGSLDDYVHQGQPRDREYAPRGGNAGQGGRGYNGAPTGSRSQINPAVMGAMMLALWALQRHNERHQRRNQRQAMRNRQNSRRLQSPNAGNPMPSAFDYGF